MPETADRIQESQRDTLTAPAPAELKPSPGVLPNKAKPKKRRSRRWLAGACLAVVVVLVGLAAVGIVPLPSVLFGSSASDTSQYLTDVAVRGPFRVTVRERGEVDSMESVLLESEVEEQVKILWIIPEGTHVEEGELLVELDASTLVEEEKQQEISLTQADAALKKAKQAIEIQRQQNLSDLAAADLAVTLTALDLEKYKDGEFPQLRNEQLALVRVAEEELALAKEVYEYSQRLARKGYVSQNQLEADRISLMNAEVTLAAAKEKLTVLVDYTYKRQIAELSALELEAGRARERIELQGLAALAQLQADLEAAKLTQSVEKERLARDRRQIANCKIYAPQAGQVIYCREDRRGDGSEVIAEGTTVYEQKDLINLPDLSKMKADARIHESMISRVEVGLPVRIRVDAIPGKVFTGKVLSVSSVPVDGSWMRPNLKEYSCEIGIDYDPATSKAVLKPGLTAEVEIIVQERSDVLQVPFQSVVTAGGNHYSFVLTDEGVERRKLMMGITNDTHVEILDGIAEGERVILNPRTHFSEQLNALDDKARMKGKAKTKGKTGRGGEEDKKGEGPGQSPSSREDSGSKAAQPAPAKSTTTAGETKPKKTDK